VAIAGAGWVASRAPSSIARADLAEFMVEAFEGAVWVGKAVQFGG
jgi:hypothetical protein